MANRLFSHAQVRYVYHTTPLHFLPEILASRELRSQEILGRERGRITARKRDHVLAVDKYVHCSLTHVTPMLEHKLQRGYLHAVLEFNIGLAPDLEFSVLPCNTKAWRSKWQCQPITDQHDVDRILGMAATSNRYRGLEILFRDRLSLAHLTNIWASTESESQIVGNLVRGLGYDTPNRILRRLGSPVYNPEKLEEIENYYHNFIALGDRATLPTIPFD